MSFASVLPPGLDPATHTSETALALRGLMVDESDPEAFLVLRPFVARLPQVVAEDLMVDGGCPCEAHRVPLRLSAGTFGGVQIQWCNHATPVLRFVASDGSTLTNLDAREPDGWVYAPAEAR